MYKDGIMKKKKPKDKIRHKNKLRKNQTAALQKTEHIRNASFDKMKRRLSDMTGVEHKIIRDKSFGSMSEALLEFAEPLMDVIDTDDYDEYGKAVMMAIVLWNCAIMQKQTAKSKEMEKLLKPLTQDADGKSIVQYMLSRKHQMFPDVNRYILDYELTDRGDEFHLSVASTIGDES